MPSALSWRPGQQAELVSFARDIYMNLAGSHAALNRRCLRLAALRAHEEIKNSSLCAGRSFMGLYIEVEEASGFFIVDRHVVAGPITACHCQVIEVDWPAKSDHAILLIRSADDQQ